jgi:hypothetical protein
MLYTKLKEIEETAERLPEIYRETDERTDPLTERLENVANILNMHYAEVKMVGGADLEIDTVEKAQKLLLCDTEYLQNETFRKALTGTQTIEERVLELEEKGGWTKWKGTMRFLPRKKDEEYNNQVKGLGEIVPSYHLSKSGLFQLDNAFNGGALIPIMATSIANLFEGMMTLESKHDYNPTMGIGYPIMMTVLMSPILAHGMHFSGNRNKNHFENSREAAKYVDKKIKTLYQPGSSP